MIRPAMKNLKIIGKHLTGLEIKNRHNENTCFALQYYTDDKSLKNKYININLAQIDSIFLSRFDNIPRKEIKHRHLIALLHEIAHYKQFKKMSLKKWLKEDEDYEIHEQREDVAIRYAQRYYKKFIKGDYNG